MCSMLSQAVPAGKLTGVGTQLLQSTHNTASYLGAYMLRCCQVFDATCLASTATPAQPKVPLRQSCMPACAVTIF